MTGLEISLGFTLLVSLTLITMGCALTAFGSVVSVIPLVVTALDLAT